MFQETNEGRTHYVGDGCGEPAHNPPMKEIKCKGVGDNDRFFEIEVATPTPLPRE